MKNMKNMDEIENMDEIGNMDEIEIMDKIEIMDEIENNMDKIENKTFLRLLESEKSLDDQVWIRVFFFGLLSMQTKKRSLLNKAS